MSGVGATVAFHGGCGARSAASGAARAHPAGRRDVAVLEGFVAAVDVVPDLLLLGISRPTLRVVEHDRSAGVAVRWGVRLPVRRWRHVTVRNTVGQVGVGLGDPPVVVPDLLCLSVLAVPERALD